ncbi:hypothetical protein G6F65_021714 [Rhizopus arrhizus]|nr:hypothetical protein G6F65_021714 [Rhizopus arrhizus]
MPRNKLCMPSSGSHTAMVPNPELHGHLHGDFHRHRARIGIEDPIQPRAQQSGQPARQGQRRFVGASAAPPVRQGVQRRAHRLGDVRVVVAVASRPPRRHAVDQATPVGKLQPAAVAAHDRQRRRGCLHLGIGKPDMWLALGHPVGRVHA